MSVHATSWAWRVPLRELLEELDAEHRVTPSVARLVLVKLGDNANDDGDAWPRIETIATETELGERTVQRALRALEAVGLVKALYRPRRSTIYTLRIKGAAPAPNPKTMGAADDTSWVPLTTETGAAPAPGTTKEPSLEPSDAKASAHHGDLIPLPGVIADPDAELSSEVTEDGAQALVGAYVDALQAIHASPPKRLVGQIARQVAELVNEGFTADVIRKALELLVERRLNPAALPSLVPEAAAGPRRPPRVPRAAADAYRRDSHREDDAERHPPPAQAIEDVERIIGRPVAAVLRGVDT